MKQILIPAAVATLLSAAAPLALADAGHAKPDEVIAKSLCAELERFHPAFGRTLRFARVGYFDHQIHVGPVIMPTVIGQGMTRIEHTGQVSLV